MTSGKSGKIAKDAGADGYSAGRQNDTNVLKLQEVPKSNKTDPLPLIKAIRESTPYMVAIYQNGSCWHFHKVLKAAFPEAEPFYFYDDSNSHVITRIGEKFYDITGEVDYAHRAKPFDEHHFPGCTKYRERWWCKFWTLAKLAEEQIPRKKGDRKLWPM